MDKRMRVWQLVGMGWYIATCLVLGILAGIWLDQALHLAPVFMLIGLAVGLGLAFMGMYRMLVNVVKDQDTGKGS